MGWDASGGEGGGQPYNIKYAIFKPWFITFYHLEANVFITRLWRPCDYGSRMFSVYIWNSLFLVDAFFSFISSPTSLTGLKQCLNLCFYHFLSPVALLLCVWVGVSLGRDSLAVFGHSFETLFFFLSQSLKDGK